MLDGQRSRARDPAHARRQRSDCQAVQNRRRQRERGHSAAQRPASDEGPGRRRRCGARRARRARATVDVATATRGSTRPRPGQWRRRFYAALRASRTAPRRGGHVVTPLPPPTPAVPASARLRTYRPWRHTGSAKRLEALARRFRWRVISKRPFPARAIRGQGTQVEDGLPSTTRYVCGFRWRKLGECEDRDGGPRTRTTARGKLMAFVSPSPTARTASFLLSQKHLRGTYRSAGDDSRRRARATSRSGRSAACCY